MVGVWPTAQAVLTTQDEGARGWFGTGEMRSVRPRGRARALRAPPLSPLPPLACRRWLAAARDAETAFARDSFDAAVHQVMLAFD